MCFCALRKRLSSYLAGITQHPACPYISPVIIAVGRRINANTFAPCMDEFKFTGFFIHIRHDTHMPDGLLGTRTSEKHKSPCCKSRRSSVLTPSLNWEREERVKQIFKDLKT